MILSHKHKFIFIKTPKTAGTSIELSLSRYCGPKDVITDLSPEDELLRPANGLSPQNYLRHYPWDYTFRNLIRWVIYPDVRPRMRIIYGQHSAAQDIIENLGEEKWNSYYKFCFERNPWDKAVSSYFFDIHYKRKNMDFKQFVTEMSFYNSGYMYRDKEGKLMIDHVARFENMGEELQNISKTIGIHFDGFLPKAKTGIRPHKRHYSEYYDEETKLIVEQKCKNVIDLMGYKFETP
jgi:hypothetical protein